LGKPILGLGLRNYLRLNILSVSERASPFITTASPISLCSVLLPLLLDLLKTLLHLSSAIGPAVLLDPPQCLLLTLELDLLHTLLHLSSAIVAPILLTPLLSRLLALLLDLSHALLHLSSTIAASILLSPLQCLLLALLLHLLHLSTTVDAAILLTPLLCLLLPYLLDLLHALLHLYAALRTSVRLNNLLLRYLLLDGTATARMLAAPIAAFNLPTMFSLSPSSFALPKNISSEGDNPYRQQTGSNF
jgi:hypothetical protein